MTRFIVCGLLTVAGIASTNAADDQTCGNTGVRTEGTLVLEGPAQPLGEVLISSSFAPDGKTAGILFTHLDVAVDATDSGQRVDTRTATLVVPLKADTTGSISQDLRGFAEADAGTRCVLLFQAAGQTHLVDLPASGEEGDDFVFSVTTPLPEGADSYTATFVLLAERDDPKGEGEALLQIDSLDLKLVPASE